METCDALIVGGGPAGSTCAAHLHRAGLDVIIADAATFPRDKVCAGWITPPVVAELRLDTEAYRQERTFQPFTGFRVGLIGGHDEIQVLYDSPAGFGIRRGEFDHYLLQRSGARVRERTPITSILWDYGQWIVNDAIRTPMLVGAGGYGCPVARWLNGVVRGAPLVVAQEAEVPIEAAAGASIAIDCQVPELYFCRDLNGYGWCVRKGEYLNVGLGRLDRHSLPAAMARFVAFLEARKKIPSRRSWKWRGHAYVVNDTRHRRLVDAGVMLVGDAAGLAYARSGEGIRPAVESGLLAAETIVEAHGHYGRSRLEPYVQRLLERFAPGQLSQALAGMVPAGVTTALGRRLLHAPAFVRRIVLDQWFLHRHQPALSV
jgi:flavin-dependent dehydrogenase